MALSWSVEILVTDVVESTKCSESKQLDGYILIRCIALACNLLLLAGFVVKSLSTVSLCQLARTVEESSLANSRAWHQFRTLHKNLDRRRWGDSWCIFTPSSWCLHHHTVVLWTCSQSDKIRLKVELLSGLKYLQVWEFGLIAQPLGLRDWDNNKL